MTPSEEAAWRSAVQKQPVRRHRNGKETKVISLRIDAGLLHIQERRLIRRCGRRLGRKVG
jgi:hypothetical protein